MVGGAEIWAPYCGAAPHPSEWWTRWNLDPLLIAILLALAFLVRKGSLNARAFIAIAVLLFVSPFCALTAALFSARTAHHILLIAGLAPLVAWSFPMRVGGVVGPTALGAVVLWIWHAPQLYAAALSSDAVYWLMQLSLFGTSVAFWSAVRNASGPQAIAALLATMVQMGLLGALLAFSTTAFYAPHALTTVAWGISPLADQQLAGLIMWVPGAGVYLGAALLLMRQLLTEPARPVLS